MAKESRAGKGQGWVSLALLANDVIFTNLSLLAAYYLRFSAGLVSYQVYHRVDDYLLLFIVETLLFPGVFFLRGAYRFQRGQSRMDELQQVFVSVSIATVLTLASSAFLSRDFAYSRAVLTGAWALAVFFIWTGRTVWIWVQGFLLARGVMQDRVLVVGTGEAAQGIIHRIRQAPALGHRGVGFVGPEGAPATSDDLPVIGSWRQIGAIIKNNPVDEVIIAEPSLSREELLDIIAQCQGAHVSIRVVPDIFQIMSTAATIGDLNGLPMVTVRDIALRGWNLSLKRAMDMVFSAAVLVLASPLMLGISLLIKLTSPQGPVFYVQERVGLDGKSFKVIKFRSMRPDAERETGPVWATKRDPRVTPLGAVLRRFSLDELPQFVNVLMGEMSVVGPRPERPHFVQQFSRQVPRYLERHREKAGLTGWAQIHGLRGDVSIEERTSYDLWYVENWTPWLDIKIMLRTIVALFRGQNAY
ncbi:MAG: undecaprenyl-phosphate glucose phosphotransferase [Chloroflexi bacterium]|nr:undecaprenyl-phosphate glucose phosphotransferase [Chloroflexota bacterium]